jgi:hypothetical protein
MLDFIERWLGIAPDKGNGGFEILLVTLLIVLLVAIALRLMIPRTPLVDRSR